MRSETSFDLNGDLIFIDAVVVGPGGHGIDGVLGMNFLLDYNIEIRTAERRILVERINP